ncbi:hypothetical protein M2132_001964 [Dysgonomonas sp. PH5-45]|nr:hypothetical protein [Dysgonomonas sp. PH5-45]MDH6388516.1 hypothetical protein [Dysgonomonas sp. PH5-37]
MLVALFCTSRSLSAQVTIGLNLNPHDGTLLQLEDGTKYSNYPLVNSAKGFGLPQVDLQSLAGDLAESLNPLATANSFDKDEHKGLEVYGGKDTTCGWETFKFRRKFLRVYTRIRPNRVLGAVLYSCNFLSEQVYYSIVIHKFLLQEALIIFFKSFFKFSFRHHIRKIELYCITILFICYFGFHVTWIICVFWYIQHENRYRIFFCSIIRAI